MTNKELKLLLENDGWKSNCPGCTTSFKRGRFNLYIYSDEHVEIKKVFKHKDGEESERRSFFGRIFSKDNYYSLTEMIGLDKASATVLNSRGIHSITT